MIACPERPMEGMRAEGSVEPVVAGHRVTLHTIRVPPLRRLVGIAAPSPRVNWRGAWHTTPTRVGTVNNDCGNSLPRMRPGRTFREAADPLSRAWPTGIGYARERRRPGPSLFL